MIIDCACQFSKEGHLLSYCGCVGPRRKAEPRGTVQKLWRAEPPTCTCDVPRYKRHREPWECKKQRPIDWIMETFGR